MNTFNDIWKKRINEYDKTSKPLLNAYHKMLYGMIEKQCLAAAKVGLKRTSILKSAFMKNINDSVDKLEKTVPELSKRSLNGYYLYYDKDFNNVDELWNELKNIPLSKEFIAVDGGANYELEELNPNDYFYDFLHSYSYSKENINYVRTQVKLLKKRVSNYDYPTELQNEILRIVEDLDIDFIYNKEAYIFTTKG